MLPTCVEAHIRTMLSLRIPVGATCVDYFMSRDGELVTSTSNPGFARAVAAGGDRETSHVGPSSCPQRAKPVRS